jgi:hypothetical protein
MIVGIAFSWSHRFSIDRCRPGFSLIQFQISTKMGTAVDSANFFARCRDIAYTGSASKGISMKGTLKFLILAAMLLGLPLAGVLVAGISASRYFEFPPRSLYIEHAPFSWIAFIAYSLFIVAVAGPFLLHALRSRHPVPIRTAPANPFPWWGWCGIVLGLVSWILAWNRFPLFSEYQAHTFTPLWIAYVLTVNGLTYRRTGTCLLLRRPLSFLLLFPASAGFWWFFEYLNRFVQNWSYTGADFGPAEYFCFASLSFSTVLPAITGTREWLLSYSWWSGAYEHFFPVRISCPRLLAALVLTASGAGLFFLGIYPNHLFALLWISPLLILVSLQALLKDKHILSPLTDGDWRFVLASALAGLLCGAFWEMWNFYSLAKWVYHVPFVQRFQVFEMPILGYAGYLPFGLECSVVAEMVLGSGGKKRISNVEQRISNDEV